VKPGLLILEGVAETGVFPSMNPAITPFGSSEGAWNTGDSDNKPGSETYAFPAENEGNDSGAPVSSLISNGDSFNTLSSGGDLKVVIDVFLIFLGVSSTISCCSSGSSFFEIGFGEPKVASAVSPSRILTTCSKDSDDLELFWGF
jgi:hypothetical protein